MDATEPTPEPTAAVPATTRTPRWLVVVGVVLLAVLVAVALQTPVQDRVPAFAAQDVSVIAHAGAQAYAPSNTIAAFDLALEQGAHVLEMDLQLTADDEVVVIHDATVDRTTGASGAVRDLTLEELRELDAGWYFEDDDGEHPYRGQGVTIPALDEVLERYPDTPLIVELKLDGGQAIIQPVIDLVRDHGRDDGSVTIASFSADYLRPVRAQLPDVPTNMPEGESTAFYVRHLAGLHPWWSPPGELFQVPEFHDGRHVVTPRFVRAAERLGVDVQVWTVNEIDQMHRLLDAGVHGIMTDHPDVLVEVLEERAAAEEADPGGYGDQLDRARELQDGPAWLTTLLHVITFLGDEEFYLLVFPVLYWAISRRLGIRLGVMLLLTAGINSIGKLVPASPRPAFLDPALERVPEATFGIPSGHSQNGAAIWGLLAASLRRWWAVVGAVALIVAIGWSRIHLGAHFLEDVLIGWTLGLVLLGLYLWLEAPVRRWLLRLRPRDQVLAGVVASLALIVPAVVLSARLQGRRFDWPGLVDVEAAIGPSAAVTPAATLAGLAIGLVLLRARGGFESDGPLGQRVLRVLAGLVGVVVLWQGLGAVFPGGEDPLALVLRYVRYALVGAWVGGVAPLLFVRFGLARPAAVAEEAPPPVTSPPAEVPDRPARR
jgi:glycerophosphoryl diester phosphodiesterase/membrane-associated phospholipid phosphatase